MEAVKVSMEIIADRRSIRKFKADEVSHGDLHEVLLAGQLAPSSKNRQPWHFTVLQETPRKISPARWNEA